MKPTTPVTRGETNQLIIMFMNSGQLMDSKPSAAHEKPTIAPTT
jgi:hypothetical protein